VVRFSAYERRIPATGSLADFLDGSQKVWRLAAGAASTAGKATSPLVSSSPRAIGSSRCRREGHSQIKSVIGSGGGWRNIDSGRAAFQGIIALLCFAAMLGPARPAMTAPPTGTIEGVAEDGQGQPLPGVQLTLRAATGWIVTRATSRTDGSYRFADIAAGDYSISGAKGRYATATAFVAVRAGERTSAYLTLAAAAPVRRRCRLLPPRPRGQRPAPSPRLGRSSWRS